jgi:hypothetical protein
VGRHRWTLAVTLVLLLLPWWVVPHQAGSSRTQATPAATLRRFVPFDNAATRIFASLRDDEFLAFSAKLYADDATAHDAFVVLTGNITTDPSPGTPPAAGTFYVRRLISFPPYGDGSAALLSDRYEDGEFQGSSLHLFVRIDAFIFSWGTYGSSVESMLTDLEWMADLLPFNSQFILDDAETDSLYVLLPGPEDVPIGYVLQVEYLSTPPATPTGNA